MPRRILHWLLIPPLMTACIFPHTVTVSPGPVPDTPAAPAVPDAYVSTLTGAAFGTVHIDGTVSGGEYTSSRPSGSADQTVNVNDARSGDEDGRSCGTGWTRSQARADATFSPAHDSARRSFGFQLTAATSARGGFWRGKVGFVCRGSNNTGGAASSAATGRLDLSFSAPARITDRLIIRTVGDQSGHIEVRDGQNNLVPLTPFPEGGAVTVVLTAPGPYSVTGAVQTRAEGGGGCPGCGQSTNASVAVSVQSMRDALSLGYGQPATETFQIPVPVFVSTDSLAALLGRQVFTPDGKFFPCAGDDGCKAKDLYLESPRVSVAGGALVIDAHLSGHYSWWFFNPGLTGDLRLSARPAISGNVVRFEHPALEVASRNAIVKYASPLVERRILDRMAAARIDISRELAAATETIRQHFPVPWGPACIMVDLNHLSVRSLEVQSAPSGLLANFGADVRTAVGEACKT